MEEEIELPPGAEEGALHGRVAGQTGRVPPEGLESCRAPCGILRALVGKLHNKVADSKELGVLTPDILESLKVLNRGLDGPDKGVDFGLCKRRGVDVGATDLGRKATRTTNGTHGVDVFLCLTSYTPLV